MEKNNHKFLHEKRCAGINCILKDNCRLHLIPANLAKETHRTFAVKNASGKYDCNKYDPDQDLENLN